MSQGIINDINKINRCYRRANREKMEQLGLKGKHGGYLHRICKHPGISQDTLVNSMLSDKGNVARDLAWLEEEGYIERQPSSEDRRISLIYPTDKALEINKEISKFYEEWEDALLEGMSKEDRDELEELLDELAEKAKNL